MSDIKDCLGFVKRLTRDRETVMRTCLRIERIDAPERGIRFSGFLSEHDMQKIELRAADQWVIDRATLSANISHSLSALALLFHKIHERSAKKPDAETNKEDGR